MDADTPIDDQGKADEAFPQMYPELRRLAAQYLRRERPDHTLQPTAVVHEAWLRLADTSVDGTSGFLALASRAIRHILIDHARKRNAARRGGSAWARVTLQEGLITGPPPDIDLLDLDAAMDRLADEHERCCRVVELRFFCGMTVGETAEALGVKNHTVERDWNLAKAWLRRELSKGAAE